MQVLLRWPFWSVASLLAVSAAACTEPVDCVRYPARCPGFVAPSAGPKPVKPLPIQMVRDQLRPPPGLPSAPPSGRDAAQVPPAGVGAQRYLQLPTTGQVPNRRPDQEPLAGQAPAQPEPAAKPGEPTRAEVTAAMQAVRPASEAHNFEGLKPFITERLYTTLAPLIKDNGDRLWRHLDVYGEALRAPLHVDIESVTGGKVQTRIPVAGKPDLRPILEKVDGAWRIDRF